MKPQNFMTNETLMTSEPTPSFQVKKDGGKLYNLTESRIISWTCFLVYSSVLFATNTFYGKNQKENTTSQ